MGQWLALLLMTVGAVFAVLWPLARKPRQFEAANDVAVYRDQLEEIRRDRATQSIGEKEAAAAELEISRRLIAAADAAHISRTAASGMAARPHRIVAMTALVLLPIGAVATYLALGSPSLPDQPLASRVGPGQSIESLIAHVEEHLRRRPDDGRGWELIAPVYMRLGRFDDAVEARRNALRLNGDNAEREAALGEALVLAANGIVTEDAKAAFDRALSFDAAQVQARYFIGLAAEQSDNREQAAKIWKGLLADAPHDAPWADFVRESLARVEPDTSSARGPTEEQIGAASQLEPDARNAMIRGMVARLAERLQRDGTNPDDWLRLVRSYMVLGEPDKARAAAGDARRALRGDAEKLQRFDELVKPLAVAQ
jgi:cytochrome c-type biogenesis protein CcmH